MASTCTFATARRKTPRVTEPTPLRAVLAAALRAQPDGPLCVAFSGGQDSSALLHVLAGLTEARTRRLRALHVDHGLHPDSTTWAQRARAFCSGLKVSCEVLPVRVDTGAGLGVEAAARDARYAALGAALAPGESLLLGHHREDQAETVLLKLLRGAGSQGLGGMRAQRPLGRGRLWRPLLEVSRAQLREYAATHRLNCLHDPSNDDTRLSRNYLRAQVLPLLESHWPQAIDSILHSAALCRDAADALAAQWRPALEALRDSDTDSLDAHSWVALAPALREPLLDHWLHARGLRAPTTAQRRQIERQLQAQPSALPCIRWPGVELHIWKSRLWALPTQAPLDDQWQAPWRGEPLPLPDGGQLRLQPPSVDLPQPLRVQLRRGGERIKPAGDRHTREMRDLFQQAQVPPWQRVACPMIYAGDELIAVADRWLSARGEAIFEAAGVRPQWQPGR